MTRKKINLPCADCLVNTFAINSRQESEYYAVVDEVWQAAGPPPAIVNHDDGDLFCGFAEPAAHFFLCIGCLELRLGRTLTPADFADCRINDPTHRNNTPRLQARLTGG